jgi:hypothetical protein
MFKKIWAWWVLVWFESYCPRHLLPDDFVCYDTYNYYGCAECIKKKHAGDMKNRAGKAERKYKALGVINNV